MNLAAITALNANNMATINYIMSTAQSSDEGNRQPSHVHQSGRRRANACLVCDVGFGSRDEFRTHLTQSRRHHFCEECEVDFDTEKELEYHQHPSRRVEEVYCQRCSLSFGSTAALHLHFKCRRDDHPFYCTECKIDLNSQQEFNDHRRRRRSPLAPSPERTPPGAQPSPSRTGFGDRLRHMFGRSRDDVGPTPTAAAVAAPAPNSTHETPNATPAPKKSVQVCAFCLKRINGQPAAAKCGHQFCASCLDEAVAKAQTCPVCRQVCVRTPVAKPIVVICPVCLRPPTGPTGAVCGHTYCRECIDKEVSAGRDCAVCRKALAIAGGGASGAATATRGLGGQCPLCLDAIKEPTSTLCGHVYCKDCITQALEARKECPVCRKFVRMQSLHPLFL